MKKIYIFIIAALCITGNYGCKKFLDQVPDDRLTFEESFATKVTVDKLLANVYSSLPDEMKQRFPSSGDNTAGPWTGASDEADYTLPTSFSNNINSGNWDATKGEVNAVWQQYYKGIQAASTFMANVGKCTDCNNNGIDLVNRYKNEIRAVRAIYYYYLIRQYGPVVLLGNDPISPDAPIGTISKPRNSFDECVDYIIAELDGAAEGLPELPLSNDDYGHINKAVIQAYKVQVLLTAASPLFNGNTQMATLKNNDGKQLINQTYSVAKWKKAADAAKAFFTAYPSFTLFTKAGSNDFNAAFLACRDVMLTDWNSEVIFARGNADITNLQYNMAPNHSNGSGGDKGGSFLSASQNLVDAYFMANGKSINDDQSGFQRTGFSDYKAPDETVTRNIQNMYVNREPRFYASITYTNRKWINPNSTVVTSFEFSGNAGKGGITNNDYSSTGYTQRKNLSTSGWTTGGRTNVVIRLAELYLDYAEALNEATPGDPDILNYLNKIRTRAGIPVYGSASIPVPASQDDMREAIRKERRVELAFESHRYFDTRRWLIAETTDKSVKGLDIQKNAANGFYNIIETESRVFEKKHYLWPIPNGEIQKVPLLVQNPGW